MKLKSRSKKDWVSKLRIDDEDLQLFLNHNWHLCQGYIRRTRQKKEGAGPKSIWFAREIVKARAGCQVDHIDGDPLNNRKSNLRIVTNAQNRLNMKLNKRNTIGFKGVSICNKTGKFQARISIDKKQIYLGNFNSPEKAGEAYNKAAKELHGIYARLSPINFEEEKIEVTTNQLKDAWRKSLVYEGQYSRGEMGYSGGLDLIRMKFFIKELGFAEEGK